MIFLIETVSSVEKVIFAAVKAEDVQYRYDKICILCMFCPIARSEGMDCKADRVYPYFRLK